MSTMPPSFFIAYAQEDTWTSLAPMPTPRTGLGVAVVNGKIYAIGGNNGASLTINEEYNPQTNTWTTKAPMPTPRSSFAIFVYQDKIHVVGGKIDSMTPTNIHQVYDPKNNTWEKLPTAQALRASGFETNLVNNKAYVISGSPSYAPPWTNFDLNNVYDLTFGNWSKKTPIPTAVFRYASGSIDDEIFIVGGYDISKNKNYDLNQIYKPTSDSWSEGTPIPIAINGAGSVATTGVNCPKRLYAIGGFANSFDEDKRDNQIYNPITDRWSIGDPMLSTRSLFGLVEVKGELYAIGGYDGNNYLGLNQKYTPIGYGTPDPTYTPPTPTPIPTLTPTPTIEPTSTPTTSPESTDVEFPILIAVSIIIIVVGSIVILVYNKTKRRS